MSTTAKAIALSAELADELRKRVAASFPVITESGDANNNPVITLSADATPAAGEKVIVLRIKALPYTLDKDVLGLASGQYTPHIIEMCTEANYAGATDNVADILTMVELLPVIAAVSARGTRVDAYVSTNGTVPSTTVLDDATKLVASYEAELYWGSLASQ
jgi:hypothetical protein